MTLSSNQSPTSFNEYAIIDMGSNSFHLIVAREVNQTLQIIYELKHHVRLATGLGRDNQLDKASIERAIQCLALFSERIKHFPKKNVRIVATYAMRRAKNYRELLNQAASILPYPIEIISGKEEARLIYLGVTHNIARKETKLVIDIGGGSTEIAIGKGFETQFVDSRPMGCVTYTERFFPHGEIRESVFRLAQLTAAQELEKLTPTVNSLSADIAFGTSGTIKAVHQLLIEMGELDGIITPQRLKLLTKKILSYKSIHDFDFNAISQQRKALIVAGLAILNALFNTLAISEIHYSGYALREGVLYEMLEHFRFRDVRQHTAISLSEQYHVDKIHARKVLKMTQHFFKQWQAQAATIDETIEPILYWAAMLHEVGLTINYSAIHKHSAYILMNSNLPGFNQEQQLLLATLVRNHRKSVKHENIPDFNLFNREQVMTAIQLLRLAVLINNQRQLDLPLDAFTIHVDKDKLKQSALVISQQVAETNQLIALDLKQEQLFWGQMDDWQLSVVIGDESPS
ncbi:exopolyphosphatase [Utexia brackfieldae]|uniref:exopolyphosphatase n=1 Tax=Utexia brackfieldae TaxID=3074108 RepID=UPI00370DAD3B